MTPRPRTARIAIAFAICCVVSTCRAANPIYDSLIGPGVKVSEHESLQLPKPALDEGLTAAQQRQLIETLLGGKYDWETFSRKSIVSPFILKLSEGTAESGPIIRKSDIYFIAYGSFDSLHDEDYLIKQLNLASHNDQADTSGRAKLLTVDELKQRNISATLKPGEPRWVVVNSTLLGKVKLSLTMQSIKTEGNDSVMVASIADPRFIKDADYPACWRPITIDDAGKKEIGPPEPYIGLASYAKATKLAEPAGAIFMEYHIALVEPQGWFHGTNLLRSKLPIVAQEIVRRFRRNLAD